MKKCSEKLMFVSFFAVCLMLQIFAATWWALDGSAPGTPPSLQQLPSIDQECRFRLTIHGFWVENVLVDGMTYQVVALPSEEYFRETGKSLLPTVGRIFDVPLGCDVTVEVQDVDLQEFTDFVPLPSQPEMSRKEISRPEWVIDRVFQTSKHYFPGFLAQVQRVSVLRDRATARVGFYPFQIVPATQTLSVCTQMTVNLRFSKATTPRTLPSTDASLSPAFHALYSRVLLNYPDSSNPSRFLGQETLLMIVGHELMTAISPLVEWKKACGLRVTVQDASSLGADSTAIKTSIQAQYDNVATRPTYVLLVGDENQIPVNYCTTANGTCPSDYPYSLLAGGENDMDPDVLIGRLVAASPEELVPQITKVIQYERNPEAGGTWYKRCLGIASNVANTPPSDKEYILQITDTLLNHSYNSRDVLVQGGTPPATIANINNALNDGRSWVTYIGHGSTSGWTSTDDQYSVAHIDQLNLGQRYPLIVSVACQNGAFVGSIPCFAERWMRAGTAAAPSGAVGFLGGTINTSWHPPAVMARGMAIQHYELPVCTWGGTYLAGQMYLKAQWNKLSDVEDNLKWYVNFSDPSLQMRTDTPRAVTLERPPFFAMGQNQLDVTLRVGGEPVSGARITAFSSTEFGVNSFALTGSDGKASLIFDCPPTLSGQLRVTVTGYNLMTVEQGMDIVSAAPCEPPTVINAKAVGPNHNFISWGGSLNEIGGYEILRASSCDGPFSKIAIVQEVLCFHDHQVEGGLTYAYRVRPICRDYVGNASPCALVTATGSCSIRPSFNGLQSIEALQEYQCQIRLNWAEGKSNCPLTPAITYRVYRGTLAEGPFLCIASSIVDLTYTDTAVATGAIYYYRVHAVDAGGNEDTNTVTKGATPLGPPEVLFSSSMEGNLDGWYHHAIVGSDDLWTLGDNRAHSPTHSWYAPDVPTASDNVLIMPSVELGESAMLTFWHWYTLESSFDGAVLEISTDGGASYSDLGSRIAVNPYTGTLSSNFGNPLGGRRAWTGSSDWKQVRVDLSGFAGQTVSVRFRIGTDVSSGNLGWNVDDVVLTHPSACHQGPCVIGDLNNDGQIDTTDLSLLAAFLSGSIAHGSSSSFTAPLDAADINTDHQIDTQDLVLLLANLSV